MGASTLFSILFALQLACITWQTQYTSNRRRPLVNDSTLLPTRTSGVGSSSVTWLSARMSQQKRGRSRDATSYRTCCSTEASSFAVLSGTSLYPGPRWISNGVLNSTSRNLSCGNRICPRTMGRRLKAFELSYVQCGDELLQSFWIRCLSPKGTYASDTSCALCLRARIERTTKFYVCFHPICTVLGFRSAKDAASMDAAALTTDVPGRRSLQARLIRRLGVHRRCFMCVGVMSVCISSTEGLWSAFTRGCLSR